MMKRCLTIDALFEGGRLFVGAISAAFLISRGVSLADIAFLKTIQGIVLVCGELPTGLFADSFGRRKSLLAAAISSAAGFLLFLLGENLPTFLLAECLTALSLCFWSGAYEAFAIHAAGLEGDSRKMNSYFHLNSTINQIAVILFGFLGGAIGAVHFEYAYAGALAMGLALFVVLLSMGRGDAPGEGGDARVPLMHRIRNHSVTALKEGLLNPRTAPLFLIGVLIQAAIQPLLHYWQPFLMELSAAWGAAELGRVFAAYCLTQALFSAAYARLSKTYGGSPVRLSLITFAGASLAYCGMAASRDALSAAVALCVLQGFLTVGRTTLGVSLNQSIPPASRATVLSSYSLFSRLGMLAALGVIGLSTSHGTGLKSLFAAFALGSLATVGLVAATTSLRASKGKRHE